MACIDALQLVPDGDGLLREVAKVLRPGGRVVITTWERRGGEPADLPPEYSVAALVEAVGLRILVREDCDDWLQQQRTLYEQVIAGDSDRAGPALRMRAEEARASLPYSTSPAAPRRKPRALKSTGRGSAAATSRPVQ